MSKLKTVLVILLTSITIVSFTRTIVMAGPQSTTYELKQFEFGAGGSDGIDSTNYSLFGTAGEPGTLNITSATYTFGGGLVYTMFAHVPPAPTVTNPGSNYDRLTVIISTGGNPTDAQYAIAASSDNWTTTQYVQSDYTIGSVLGTEDWTTYSGGQGVGWGGATGFVVTGLTSNTTYAFKVKARSGKFTETGWNIASSAATLNPTMSFGIDSEFSGLVGFWKMDEGSGVTASDSSGIGNHLTWQGSQGDHWTTGRYGNAVNVTANTEYLDITNPASLQLAGPLTVAAWVKVNSYGSWRTILSKSTGSVSEYWFGFNTANQLSFMRNPGTADDSDRYYVNSTSTITDSSWHHVAAVYDTRHVTLYIDGVLANTPELHATAVYTGSGDFDIGYVKRWGVSLIDGSIDEVRVYNTAHSATEMKSIYEANPALSKALYFNNLNSGNSYTDSSKTTVLTTSTNAYNGYIVYGRDTQPLTFGAYTIADYAGTNGAPTTWTGTGFGYTTSDNNLTGGTADRFTNGGPKYAGFGVTTPGDPVADHVGPVTSPISNEQFTVSYRVTTDASKPAGEYKTTVVYVIVPNY